MERNFEPLAIVAMACRFPRLDSIDELWAALCDRFVAAGEVPPDRWDVDRYFSSNEVSKGKTWTRRANFVNQDVRTFDASFFGISPREAENMDPQQRLILEVVWEAFENGGMKVPDFAGKPVGVYVGGFMMDHMITSMGMGNRTSINQHTAAGMMMTMLSNRVSHTFDFRGPSMSIDTACSSSLVAFHYGCQDVWRGECDMAVVGGTNVMMRPEYLMGMAKGHFISRDGESKSFDERADGYGRGEGAGAVLIKTLAQAQADGDKILSLVAATGTNQDGHTPGISMPNGESQLALINKVCEQYDIDPKKVNYVECHGTGTGIGDPIECGAIGEAYGSGRTGDDRVVIGSIKSNIGHTEAVAGIAGVIKATLNIMNRTATPLGNLQSPREDIDFEGLGIRLSDDMIPLGKDGEPVMAAINSFGYGGSNAHVVLQSAPDVANTNTGSSADTKKADHEMPYVLPVSGRSKEAVSANAAALVETMTSGDASLADVIYTATSRRTQFNNRAVAMGHDRDAMLASLTAIAEQKDSEYVVQDTQPIKGNRDPVFVFTGMGPQWWYMGQELYKTQPIYKEFADRADAVYKKVAGFSILEEMLKSEEDSQIQKTIYAQPANLVIQIGVYEMLKSYGLKPGAVVGHSVGELGSAYAAGVLSLEDAMLVSYHRSTLQAETAGTGGMLAVGVSKTVASNLIEPYKDVVSLAAINGPTSVTLAGCIDSLKKIEEALVAEGTFAKALEVEIPYHSPLMVPLMERLEKALESVKTNVPELPLYSTVTGELVTEASFGAKYWPLNIRQPVEFEDAINAIVEEGYNTFVEVGPHPVLSASLKDCLQVAGSDCRLIHTLRRNLPNESLNVQRAVMGVYASGCDFDWAPFLSSEGFVQLPNYRWQREHLWVENERAEQDRINPIINPILGTQDALATPVWRVDFDHESVHYLRDHVVSNVPILPAAGYLESLLELCHVQFPNNDGMALRDIKILSPMVLFEDVGLDFTTTYDPTNSTAIIRSQENGLVGNAQVHLTGRIGEIRDSSMEKVNLDSFKSKYKGTEDVVEFYKKLKMTGLSYGPMFQTIKELTVDSDEGLVFAKLELDPSLEDRASLYKLHPTMLDGAFQALMALLVGGTSSYLPTQIEELCYYGEHGPSTLYCTGRLVSQSERELICDLTLYDEAGNVCSTIRGFKATAAPKADRLDKWGEKVELKVVNYQWDIGDNLDEPKRLGHWLSIGDAGEFSEAANRRINDLGGNVVGNVVFGDAYSESADKTTVVYNSYEDAKKVMDTVGQVNGIVFYGAIDEDLRSDCPTAEKAISALLMFSRAVSELPVESRPRIYVATQTAFAIDEQDTEIEPGSTAVNGYVRVARKEMDGCKVTSVDLPDDIDDEDLIEAFAFELLCDANEDEVAIRGDARFVSEMLIDETLNEDVVVPTLLDDQHPIILRPNRTDIENLGLVRCIASHPVVVGDNDVHIRVESTLLPGSIIADQKTDQLDSAWIEIVGHVVETGNKVTDLKAGMRVCGYAPSDLASHLCFDRSQLHLIEISADADASQLVGGISIPTGAVRAVEVQDVEEGDTALVWASPMGHAVAKLLSAKGVSVSLVTDKLDAIEDDVKALYKSVYHASPESLEQAVQEQTEGAGFSGLVVQLGHWVKEFDCRALRDGGWIVDTDQNVSNSMLPARVGIVSRAATAAALSNPTKFASALQQVVAGLSDGSIESEAAVNVTIADIAWQVLPVAEDARVVVSYDIGEKDLPVVQTDELSFSDNATYLITGGFGGFGHKTAEWLIDNGARHLVLTGRTGASTPKAKAIVENLESMGATVKAAACDTADYAAVEAMIKDIDATMPPLKGVYHCGAVIIDEAIPDVNLDNFGLVMTSKATGAYNLHKLTEKHELDEFVMYSSIANLIGNTRQCAYSAANGYLNGLAHMRAANGLAATAVNWGAIDEVGVVAEDEKLEMFFKTIGIRAIPVDESLQSLKVGLARKSTQFGLLLAQWADWGRYESIGDTSNRYETLIEQVSGGKDGGARDQLVAELAPLAPGARSELMCQLLQQVVGSVLKSDPESIEVDRPISELGIDSLMATEIQMSFESNLGLSISVMELIGDITIRALGANSLTSLEFEMAKFNGESGGSKDAAAEAPSEESAGKSDAA